MNDKWIDRIKSSEALPPEKGWDEVASSLDESFNGHTFPVTLYNAEAAPPIDTWNKIQSSLDEAQAPVIPIKKTYSFPSILKYAAAACLIGLLAFGAIKFFGIDTGKIEAAANNGMPVKEDTSKGNKQSQTSSAQSAPEVKDADNEALEENKHTYAKLDLHSRNIAAKISSSLYRSPAQLANTYAENASPKRPELQYSHRAAVNDSPADQQPDRYVMYKNSEGKFIRLSKKLTDIFCCVSGEEQDKNCTDQLKKWREKIAASSFVPSPDNFMDILDLARSLEDSRN